MTTLSKIVSYLFHPLLFPLYGSALIIGTNPQFYGHFGDRLHFVWLIIVFALTLLFPVIWLAMMKRLEMIQSFELESSKERIIPYIAAGTFYLWTAWMFKPNANMKIPSNEMIFLMMLGTCIALFMGFFINIFSKVSLHGMGVGSFLGLCLILIKISPFDLRFVLLGAILMAGITGTARLILKAHSENQVFTGYFVGFAGQFLAFSILSKLI